MAYKYLLLPGPVKGQTCTVFTCFGRSRRPVYVIRRDVHHVCAPDLAKAYGVDLRECRVLPWNASPCDPRYRFPERLIPLLPRDDGDYTLPGRPRRRA